MATGDKDGKEETAGKRAGPAPAAHMQAAAAPAHGVRISEQKTGHRHGFPNAGRGSTRINPNRIKGLG